VQVKAITIQRDKFLRANVAGTVMITRERIDPDLNQPDMEMMYGEKVRLGVLFANNCQIVSYFVRDVFFFCLLYSHLFVQLRAGMRLHKLTFNVVPDELKGRFILKHEQ
jgi:hypothetical protein